MENPGVETAIPEGAQPQPCILQNDNGMKFSLYSHLKKKCRKEKEFLHFLLH